MILSKLTMLLVRRREFLSLIAYTKEEFWRKHYDEFGRKVMRGIDKKGLLLMCSFTFFVNATVFCYVLRPLTGKCEGRFEKVRIEDSWVVVENIGRNGSDRILPFTLWIDAIPSTTSPYYEILFGIEVNIFHGILVRN